MQFWKRIASMLLTGCLMISTIPTVLATEQIEQAEQASEIVSGHAHTYKNGICTRCGAGEPNCPIDAFSDISKGQWYHDGIHFVLENGLMAGVTSTEFKPNDSLRRAMITQIMYASEGKPTVIKKSPFSDVSNNAWYAKSIIWAANNDIVSGVGNNVFAPMEEVTREQLAVMLYSAAHKPSVSGSLKFADASSVSSWAKDAMLWAAQHGIVSGSIHNGAAYLNPQGNATRVQAAVMIMQFIENA